MKQKKIPLRKCLVTREQFPKKELIRVVVNKDKEVNIDLSGKMNGRGAYLKLSKENIELAKKRSVLEKEFQVNDLDYIYDELLDLADE
ncbi:putative RNA-binding protein YlxR (DUF448 family) [Bacilli bacterium PM5-3]|nr:putative RNA-binding protein YlxR (DUF448 family) [Bacilli bacterium PM5-3]MDH6603701.1 putative RNA-binding protein YlxR (DUF448 family) [Bacilli bacterium PM5-9]